MARAFALFWRAGRLRCPNCGGRGIVRNWMSMAVRCPACGFRLEREEGFFTGAMAVNLVVAELVFLGCFIAAMILTWPNTPWGTLQIAAIVLMLFFPILFYPFSRTLWLAFDLLLRPARETEMQPAEEPPAALMPIELQEPG